MEDIYKSLFAGHDVLSEQFVRQLFELSTPDGPVMIYVNPDRQFQASDPVRVPFLHEEPRQLSVICDRIDDGDDPCVCEIDGGCVIGMQLSTENTNCGYFLLFLSGYAEQTVQTNMDIFELVLAQAQLICQLMEKNNQLHHLRLSHLSKSSKVLS